LAVFTLGGFVYLFDNSYLLLFIQMN